ncbi:flavin reductase family protein [uncultured Sulfitobacter sp.]|uniref:flavin reductase family protein n=1 Tax=uncultured Sulfitobacter sp. TaxID=191468 RepID=UPI0026086FCA|nr:flavin reductase family protein [uncultured Sulfitobacter sp.]
MTLQINPQELRSAFGSFLTGVTVVTARRDDGAMVGFTANSFTSVSIDPPLLLVCPGKFLSSYATFAACTHFAVNILAQGQQDIANIFASYKGDRFARVAHRLDRHEVALIEGAAAHFSCTRVQALPMGDHCILIGRVDDFSQSNCAGLGYHAGQYFRIGFDGVARQDVLERT